MSREDRIIAEILQAFKDIDECSTYVLYSENEESTYDEDKKLIEDAIHYLEDNKLDKIVSKKERMTLYG